MIRKWSVTGHENQKRYRKKLEGSFRLKNSGRVEYRISYRNEFGKLVYKSFSGADKNECLIRAEEFMEKVDLRCQKSSKKDKVIRGFTVEEQAVFLKTLDEYPVSKRCNNYKLRLLIELYSGMRMGEINTLKPENIDFKKKIVKVRNTVSRRFEYRDFIKEGTKTSTGTRDIPMNRMLEKYLHEALKKMSKNREGLVFYDHRNDKIISTSQVNCYYRRV